MSETSMSVPPETYAKWFNFGVKSEWGMGVFFEEIIRAVYSQVVQPGDCVIDGGAHNGRHTWPMSQIVGPAGLVIGFEAIPEKAAALVEHQKQEGIANVSIVNKAVGAEAGQAEFVHVKAAPGYSGLRQRKGVPDYIQKSIDRITVEVVQMDSLLPAAGARELRFIKLDLEGGEYNALQGASKIMTQQSPLIIFENGRANAAQVYEYDSDEWFELFASTGYRTFDLFGREFGPENWTTHGVPWYFIAAKRSEDIAFVSNRLTSVIEGVFEKMSS